MFERWAKVAVLASAIYGLCTAVQANTTAPATATSSLAATSSAAIAPQRLAQTDLALPPVSFGRTAQALPQARTHTRIALLLPLRSEMLGRAAIAVRNGFQAAYDREPTGMSITLIETDDDPAGLVTAYASASAANDIVVGPLSRSGVVAIAHSGVVNKPTIALNTPENPDDMRLPPQMLAIGLPLEDESRQVADWINNDHPAGRVYVVHTSVDWQRRAAQAFAAHWQQLGRKAELMEVQITEGYLHGKSLEILRQRLNDNSSAVLFAALDAWQAQQLRESVGRQVPLYGTSQLNPIALQDQNIENGLEGLDGVRLVDIPWQLQPDHPAVMIYPRPDAQDDARRSADLARLYALGIDAFRVAREITSRQTDFRLDGVTGKLSVRMNGAESYFERVTQRAEYRNGTVMPLVTP
jgi:outer membrane PBP1 activator LpoA protein